MEYAYVKEQESAGLIRRFGPGEDVGPSLQVVLREEASAFRHRAGRFAAQAGDLNRYIVETLHRVSRA
jgi:hypothetical protein